MDDDKYLIKGVGSRRDDADGAVDSQPLIVTPGSAQHIRPARVQIRKGFDAKGRPAHSALTTLSEVEEEHIYLIYHGLNRDVVIEADMLGDQTTQGSDGKLPPVIHIECPRCTQPDKPGTPAESSQRSMLSITHGNKHFELEDLEPGKWGVVTFPDGKPVMATNGQPAIVKRRLTVKETFKCSYCHRAFKITDNIMSDA